MIHEQIKCGKKYSSYRMSDREDSTSSRNNNQINMSEKVVRQFEKLFGDMRGRLDRLNAMVTNLQRGQQIEVPNARRREPRMEVNEEFGDDSDIDEDVVVKAEMGMLRNGGAMFEKRGRNNVGDEVDESTDMIKMSIPPFKKEVIRRLTLSGSRR